MIWDEFIDFGEYAKIMMEGHCGRPTITTNGPHTDIRYTSKKTDLANISIIDCRDTKKMWMMHIACFSKDNYPMPIYGFDIICGKNKITGCFHDMSPTSLNYSQASQDFILNVTPYIPKRTRELPTWAKEIFSPHMVVAGATDDPKEIKNLVHMGKENLHAWFKELDTLMNTTVDWVHLKDYKSNRSKYCQNQLENTNSKNVMISLGLDPDYVTQFKKQQFPY